MILKVKNENGEFKEVVLKGLKGDKGDRGEDGTVLQQKEIDDIKSSLDNIMQNVIVYTTINVLDYGVKGDGITNDAPALQSIFSTVEDNTKIVFPKGTYILGDGGSNKIHLQLYQKNNIIIEGESDVNTDVIIKAHPQTPCSVNNGLINIYRCNNTIIRNLELDGNLQERSKAVNDVNWGDASAIHPCSNLSIKGGYGLLIDNIYSHHPIMDCIQISRHAGGTTPNGSDIKITNCTFSYGYRQGITIEGFNNGIIDNCIIEQTAKAPSLITSTKLLGISPKAGIDSETWSANYNWVLSNCTFTDNYINCNDGTINFTFKHNTFNNSTVSSETPSAGLRTYNIDFFHNVFNNSGIDVRNHGFNFQYNTFNIPNNKTSHIINFNSGSGGGGITYPRGAKNNKFSNNIVRVEQADEYIYLDNIIYQYSARETEISNNVFIDCNFKLANTNTTNTIRSFNNSFITTTSDRIYLGSSYSLGNNHCASNIIYNSNKMNKEFTRNTLSKRFKILPTSLYETNYQDTGFAIKLSLYNEGNFINKSTTKQVTGFKLDYEFNSSQYLSNPKGAKLNLVNQQLYDITGFEVPMLSPIIVDDGYFCIDISNPTSVACRLNVEIEIFSKNSTNIANVQKSDCLFFSEISTDFSTFINASGKAYAYNKNYVLGDIVYFPAYGSTIKYECVKEGKTPNDGTHYSPNISFTLGEVFTLGTCEFKAIEMFDNTNYYGLTVTKCKSNLLRLYDKPYLNENTFIFLTDKLKHVYKYNKKWYYLSDGSLVDNF